jgi:hypothetical protein
MAPPMDPLGTLIAGYCAQAGVAAPAPREDGSYALHFETAGVIEFSSFGAPDTVMLRAQFATPQQKDGHGELLRPLMGINLMLASRKRATLTIDAATDTPFLYDIQKIDPRNPAAGHQMILTFANEAAAFRSLLARVH